MLRRMLGLSTMAFALALLFCTAASAGNEDVCKAKGSGAGGFAFGFNRVDLSELDAKLKGKGFEGLSNDNIFYGGAGYGVVRGKILLGGEGGGFSQDVSSDSLKASVDGGCGFFNVGYVVYSRGGLSVFPLLGIGGSTVELRIVGREDAPSFDALLGNPRREVNVSTAGLLFGIGVGADYLLVLGGDEEGKGGLLFGVRAGYTFSATEADWMMVDRDVLRGPDVRMTGPYVHLIFGGGGSAK